MKRIMNIELDKINAKFFKMALLNLHCNLSLLEYSDTTSNLKKERGKILFTT